MSVRARPQRFESRTPLEVGRRCTGIYGFSEMLVERGNELGRDDLEELQRVLREQTARLNGLITRRGGERFELVLPAKRA